jgi:hypothetical protein
VHAGKLARLFVCNWVNNEPFMKYFLFNLLVAGAMISCTSNSSRDGDNDKQMARDSLKNVVDTKVSSGCYRMIIDRDTADLRLDINGNIVKGSLLYNRFEKDDNNGELDGIIENNIIKAWYRYRSESLVSVKQVYFKINGDKLEEGYGDVAIKGDSTNITHDTAYFKYPAT